MLVISRKKGESVLIGDDIEVTIVKADDGTVKLAIDAPQSVRILRKELYNQVKSENKKAVNFDSNVLKQIKNNK
ncbi:carbon storage regulator CsrA [Clostridium oceanicum]|uniref:Translational regulator CsrA n=1 Tax=Clostridium oceanicum TaxID=1543 RepID=A0ABN1JTT5_9CLOT